MFLSIKMLSISEFQFTFKIFFSRSTNFLSMKFKLKTFSTKFSKDVSTKFKTFVGECFSKSRVNPKKYVLVTILDKNGNLSNHKN